MGANIPGFNIVVLLVVGNVSIGSEASVVTLSISGICRSSLRRCLGVGFCVRAFVGMSVSALYCVILKKLLDEYALVCHVIV